MSDKINLSGAADLCSDPLQLIFKLIDSERALAFMLLVGYQSEVSAFAHELIPDNIISFFINNGSVDDIQDFLDVRQGAKFVEVFHGFVPLFLVEISDKNGFSKSTRKTISAAWYNGFSNCAVIRGNPKRVARNARI